MFPAMLRPEQKIPSLRSTFFCTKLGTECTKEHDWLIEKEGNNV
jgi:hypothetical protein